MLWDDIAPADKLIDASDIYTYIQNAKVMLSERMQANNGTIDQHNLCDADEDGIHESSKIGFVNVSTWADRINPGKEGTLHYITSPLAQKGLYTYDQDINFVLAGGVYEHWILADLLDDSAHTIYLLASGTRAMTGDLTIEDVLTITDAFGAGNTDALDVAHVALSWYAAHGADSVAARHILAASIGNAEINYVEQISIATPYENTNLDRAFPFLTARFGAGTTYSQTQSGGVPTLTTGGTMDIKSIQETSSIV